MKYYFCFEVTGEEYTSLRCQFVTLEKPTRETHRKYLPYVYTEHGVAMLSPLLNSKIAVEVSIKIVRAFIEMRNVVNF
jgi:phage regulator Rha-like protein